MTIETLNETNCFGGRIGFYKHASEANHWMLAHHGIFQGYYFWHHIGLDRNARDAHADSPYYEYTEEFCAKYDQTAFDADYVSNPLEHYEPLIRELLHGR